MDKRLILFFVCAASVYFGWYAFVTWKYPEWAKERAKATNRPKKPANEAKLADKSKLPEKQTDKDGKPQLTAPEGDKKNPAQTKVPALPPQPKVPLVNDIPLGKDAPGLDSEYPIFARFSNQGALLSSLQLNAFKAEDKKTPLMLLQEETPGIYSYALSIPEDKTDAGLQNKTWEVVERKADRIVFRSTAMGGNLQVEKRYILDPGSYAIRLEVVFKNIGKAPIKNMIYNLTGGNGLPIEGKWYTRYFRQMATMMLSKEGSGELKEALANEIGKRGTAKPLSYQATPVQFSGIECQYFASVVIQQPIATQERLIASVESVLVQEDAKKLDLSNIGIKITSVPVAVEPGKEVTHQYLLFNGPKNEQTLEKYAEFNLPMLIVYRNFLFIPIGSVAKLMVMILNFLFSLVHDYGVSIIILTVIVRGAMFPLTIRQTRSAVKMQQLAPKIQELKEKFANDKERQSREMMALYAKEKVNPLGGCLIMFIQLPIFVGLYQALAQSFTLRHSSFFWDMTWIKDLAAPDQLFPFGFNMPFLGPYFNLLPILSVSLQMVQMKFMSPPTANATPEQEMQRKMMMWMMVFVAFMFYTVPSGLCVYFLTSGLWSIMERKILPKPQLPAGGVITTTSNPVPSGPASDNGASWKTPIDKKKSRSRG